MSRHRTAGSAAVLKEKKAKYTAQYVKTEANRKRKRLAHFRKHPNNIKGVEELRKSLGI